MEGGDSITFCNMGGCCERLNRNEEAREYYKKAAKLNPNVAEAWFGVGLTYDKDGFNKEALQYFKRAILLEPENPEYLLVLAECEFRMGYKKEAEAIYLKITEMDPGLMEAWLDWSFVKYSDNDIQAAISLLEKAISYDNFCHQYHYRMVVYLFENLRIKEALSHLETALTLNHADHFLMFEIKPELAKVHEITLAIEAFREEL
jgi:tetratricopeptide (TPR) repeat protein